MSWTHWGRDKMTKRHALNQSWYVNWTLANKLQQNFNQNLYILVQGNACENRVRTWRRQHAQVHFLQWTYISFGSNFTEICSCVSNLQHWHQAVVKTNNDQVHCQTHLCVTRPQQVQSLVPGGCGSDLKNGQLQTEFMNLILAQFIWNRPLGNATELHCW